MNDVEQGEKLLESLKGCSITHYADKVADNLMIKFLLTMVRERKYMTVKKQNLAIEFIREFDDLKIKIRRKYGR